MRNDFQISLLRPLNQLVWELRFVGRETEKANQTRVYKMGQSSSDRGYLPVPHKCKSNSVTKLDIHLNETLK